MSKKHLICPAQKTLELLSRSHMLHIIYTFSTDVWGFNQLQQVTGINTRTLTKRLQELQEAKLVKVVECKHDARCKYYQLTKKGNNIHEVLTQLH